MMNDLTFLEKRLMKLEQLVYERSVGRGGPSIAMNMWTFLMDHGPSTVADIDAGLGPRYSNKPTIKSYLDAGLITKQGDTYVANPDYNWDDVGKIERPSLNAANIKAAIDNGSIVNTDDEPNDNAVTGNTRSRAASRARTTRAVKANIFSRKFDEVKAAVDGGVDVNLKNAANKTALQYALMSDKPDAAKIVKYLLDHGASLEDYATGKPLIFEAIKNNNHEAAEALIERGTDIVKLNYKNKTVWYYIIDCGYDGDLKPFAAYDKNVSGSFYDFQMNAMLTDAYRGGLDKSKVLEFIDKMMDLIIENSLNGHFYYNFDDTLATELDANRYDVSKSVIMRKLAKAKLWSHAISTAMNYSTELYKLMEKAYNEKWRLVDCSQGEFNSMAINLGLDKQININDSKMISDMLTPEAITKAANSDKFFVYELISTIKSNTAAYAKILNSIAKSKIRLSYHSIAKLVDNLTRITNTSEKDVTRAGCRLLATVFKNGSQSGESINVHNLRQIVSCKNEYFIEFMIESGFGEKMASSKVAPYASDVCEKILKEYGFDIGAKDFDFDKEARYNRDVLNIVGGIQEDESGREFRSLLQEKPELLDDPTIRRVANDPEYRNNFTAKLVQRAIADREASNPDGQPKYDF